MDQLSQIGIRIATEIVSGMGDKPVFPRKELVVMKLVDELQQ